MMKRIVSLVVALLMVMTTFCSILTVGSSAEGLSTYSSLVKSTVKIVDDDTTDDLVRVQLWVKDESPYGIKEMKVSLAWDSSKIAPVTKSYTGDDDTVAHDVAFDIYNIAGFSYDYSGNKWNVMSPYSYTIAGSGRKKYLDTAYMHDITTPASFSIQSTAAGFDFSYDFLDGEGLGEYYTYNETDGLLFGEATFQILSGATGKTDITAGFAMAYLAADSSATPAGYNALTDNQVTNGSDTLIISEEATTPSVSTFEGASIRYVGDYNGLRFTSSITATAEQFDKITKVGTLIYPADYSVDDVKAGKVEVLDIQAYYGYASDDANATVVNMKTPANLDGTYNFNAVISNFKEANVSRDFCAMAYYVMDGVTVYGTPVTNSAKAVAQSIIDNSYSGIPENDTNAKAVVDAYAEGKNPA